MESNLCILIVLRSEVIWDLEIRQLWIHKW